MGRRTLVLSTIVAAGLSFAIAFAIAAQRRAPAGPAKPSAGAAAATSSGALPVLFRVPPFSFPDQDAKLTSTSALRGHVWIADFIFTSCTSICPLITARMALLQRRLESRKNLRFVSFSVDPARDTPEALKKYANEWRPTESRWILLSTTTTGLENLAKAMYVSVEPTKNDINHTNLFFLVDAEGGVRGIYESDKDGTLERLVEDAEMLSDASPSALAPPRETQTGSEIYANLGCGACHARRELGPPLAGLAGRRVTLKDGAELTADAAYVRESIVAPSTKLVAGYATPMPSYAADLSSAELDRLVEHVMMLPPDAPAPKAPGRTTPSAELAKAAPTTPAETEPSPPKTEPATVAIDPVCSMEVRVTDATPRTTHAGHTVYFCSEMCRNRFVAEPARFAKP